MQTSTSVAPIHQGEPSPLHTHSHPVSLHDEDSHHDPYSGYTTHDEGNWGDDDDVSESETSTSYGRIPPPRAHTTRLPLRTAPLPHPPSYHRPPARRPPNLEPSVAPSDDFGPYGQGYTGGQYGRGGYPRGAPQHPQGYGAAGYYQNAMVGYNNPFNQISSPSSNGSYYSDPRAYGNEMAHFPPYYHPGYPQQYQVAPPGAPHDAAPAAGPSAREKELQDKIAAFEKEKAKQEQEERQKEIEAEARRKADEESKKYKEEMKRMLEQNKLEIERARTEAERAARDKIEAERKANEERARQQEEAVKAAEERVRIQFEQQMRAAEARRKKEEEDRVKAEEAAKLRLEAALRADAEMKKLQAEKAAQEAAKLKQIQEDAKRKADAEMAAKIEAEKEAAKKKAEDEALAKQERDAFKKKVEEETKASLEEKAKKDRGPVILFKDALGRKYNFPYRLCTTWPSMEDLIKQAFENVDELAQPVNEGWYDLIGPSGEIILPSVWEKVLEPEWSITMTMWPADRIRSRYGPPPMHMGRPPVPPGHHAHGSRLPPGVVPPPGWPGAHGRHGTHVPDGIKVMSEKKDSKKKKGASVAAASFFGGKPQKKKSSKK